VRRILTADFLDDFFFDPDYINLIGASRDSQTGQVINLDTKKRIATIPMAGMPHLASGITWDHKGKSVFASPNIKDGRVTVIDMESWQVVKEIKTQGPGFFMRSHSKSPYAWVDVFLVPTKIKFTLLINPHWKSLKPSNLCQEKQQPMLNLPKMVNMSYSVFGTTTVPLSFMTLIP
jgi:hypothetical protein